MRKREKKINQDNSGTHWKRRQSEIRGYQRTLYINADNRDYLRVDYNLREKRVRLYVEVSQEGGSAYYAVISNGRVTTERNADTGRPVGVKERLSQRADIFSTIKSNEVLRLIGGHYGVRQARRLSEAHSEKERLKQEARERYFKPGTDEDVASSRIRETAFARFRWFDIADILIGGLAGGLAYWHFNYNMIIAGIVLAFYGMITGLFDMFFRGRPPLFLKMIGFIVVGIALYLNGYFL